LTICQWKPLIPSQWFVAYFLICYNQFTMAQTLSTTQNIFIIVQETPHV